MFLLPNTGSEKDKDHPLLSEEETRISRKRQFWVSLCFLVVVLFCYCAGILYVCFGRKVKSGANTQAVGGHRAVQGALGAVGSGGVCCAVAMETVMCAGQGNCRAQQRRAEPSPGKGL